MIPLEALGPSHNVLRNAGLFRYTWKDASMSDTISTISFCQGKNVRPISVSKASAGQSATLYRNSWYFHWGSLPQLVCRESFPPISQGSPGDRRP